MSEAYKIAWETSRENAENAQQETEAVWTQRVQDCVGNRWYSACPKREWMRRTRKAEIILGKVYEVSVVVGQWMGQTPLYTKCNSGTKKRVLHCNVLLPCTYLQVDKVDVRPRDKDNVRQQNQNASSRHSKHFNRKTCIASQAIKDEDIPSLTNAHSSNTVDHPGTGEFSTHITYM